MKTLNVCRLLILLILNLTVTHTLVLEEGSECDLKHNDDESGTCVLVTICQPALKSVKTRKSHDFNRCGFRGRTEIVCCPNSSILGEDRINVTTANARSPSSTSKAEVRGPRRKSAQVCDELSNNFGPKVSFQILGGTDAVLGEFPHMAALGYRETGGEAIKWNCGGSLISDRYVLTAAHCIVNIENNLPIKIRMGKVDINGESDGASAIDIDVANITIHPQYNRRLKQNDIALIRLRAVVKNSDNVYPACLYNEASDPLTGLVITGWGLTAFAGDTPAILQKGFLDSVPLAKCNISYQSGSHSIVLQKHQFCAVSSDGKTDACQGDSGGPIQIQKSTVHSIVGVTSFGKTCGGSAPGIYTRVSSFLDWIEDIVWPNN